MHHERRPAFRAICFAFRFLGVALCAAGLPGTPAVAAPGDALWVTRADGLANITANKRTMSMAVDGNGNVFVLGQASIIAGDTDYVTLAYSGTGVLLWTNRYNGPANSTDLASAIAVDGSGNVFVTGDSKGVGSGSDYATIKYSGAGVPLWTNRYNGPANSTDAASAIAVDGSGNVFVTGLSSPANGNYDYATVAYSGAGVPLWTNRYNGPVNGVDSAIAVSVDGSGNVFVTGTSQGSGSSSDYATIKYSGVGVALWTNRYNGSLNGGDGAMAMAVDRNGNVFVTGSSAAPGTGTGAYATVAYSGAGVALWTNLYSGPLNGFDSANAIAVDRSGNVFVTGYSVGDYSALDYATVAYSGAGVPLWTNRYNGPLVNSSDVAYAIAVDGNGNVFVTGESASSLGGYHLDYATVAYSGAGVPLWTNRYNGPASIDDTAQAIALDGSGNVFVAGYSISGSPGSINYDFTTIKYAALLTLSQTAAANGQFQFQFNADSNLTYAVEFRDFLNAGNWTTLTNIAAQPAATNFPILHEITNSARFFRVRTP